MAKRGPSSSIVAEAPDALAAAPSFALVALISVVLHADGVVTQQRDGVEHVVRGVVLARGGSVEILQDFYTLNLRMVGLASAHSLGSLWGAELLMAWVPVLAMATVMLTVMAIRHLTRPDVGGSMSVFLGVAGAVLLLTMPMFLYAGLSLLPHVPMAAAATLLFVLIVARRPGTTIEDGARHGGHVIGMLAMSLVLIKPDGLFIAALLLLGLRYADRRTAVVAWRYVGFAMVGWQVILLRAGSLAGTSLSRDVLAQVLAGLTLLAFSGALLRLSARAYGLITSAPLMVIGVALLLAAVTRRIDGSIDALRANLVGADGGWGAALAVLLVAALVAAAVAAATRSESLQPLVLTVLGLPAIFLLIPVFSASLGGGYRIGVSDSMNRMWVNILPLIVILVITALATIGRRAPALNDTGAPTLDTHEVAQRARMPIAAAAATLGMLIVAVALPTLPAAKQDPKVLISTGSTDDLYPIGEITSNVRVITTLELSDIVPISPALHEGRLCLDLLPANYADRVNAGVYTTEFRLADRSEWWVVDMEDVQDFVPARHCFERLRPRDLDALLRDDAGMTISGQNGQRGASTTLLFTRDPAAGSVLEASGLTEPIPDGYLPFMELIVEPSDGLRWAAATRMTTFIALLVLLIGAWEWRRSQSMAALPSDEGP